MTLRSSTAAIVILLVVLGAVFVLVGHAGVATSVFLAQDTLTPLPPASADHWTEDTPGQLTYSDPSQVAQVTYEVIELAQFAEGNGLQLPAADSQTPLLDVLTQFRAMLGDLLVERQFTTGPDTLEGPTAITVGEVPLVLVRLKLDPQPSTTFAGTEIALALIDLGAGKVDLIQYVLNGPPDPVVYQDFMAWLEANAPRLSSLEALATPTPTPAAEATEAVEPTAEATEAAAPAAEVTEAATPAIEATEAAAPAVEGTEAATPAAEGTEPAVSEGPSAGNWVEMNPGVLTYMADPNVPAQLGFQTVPLDQFVQMARLQPPAVDAESQTLDLLQQMRTIIEGQIIQYSLAGGADAFVGPLSETVGGVQMDTLHVQIAPQPAAQEGDPDFLGLDMAVSLIDRGDGTVTTVQYMLQAEPNPAAYADYRAWLETNAATLVAPSPEATTQATEAAAQ